MNETICNLCWEFCYEVIPAQLNKNNEPCVLILNLPLIFSEVIESLLKKKGFSCVTFKPHGKSAVIMKFEKVMSSVGG